MGDLSELRIVLLGCRGAGKSSTGNTIMGKEEFDLKRSPVCVTSHGQASGRQITVVEAPGWWSTYPLKDLASISKQEIELSASVCSPGPHAFLLVIRVDTPFTEVHRVAVEEHLTLFGQNIWHHTIVLFTYGDHLGDITIEQHIEREGKALQWIVQTCCERYHVFNNLEKDNVIQVAKVLNQIEEMVAKSSCYYYGIDEGTLQRKKERRMEEKERAVKRRRMMLEQWQELRCQIGDTHFIPHLRIVLLGNRAAGKSSAGNTILGKEVFALKRSAQCVKREGEVSGWHVTVIEAPGWWKNFCVEYTPALNKQEVVNSVCSQRPHAVVLIIRLDTPFTKTHQMVAKQQLELLGEIVWSSTIVLFTCGDWLGDTTIEEHIESEGLALQWVIEKCGNRYHVLDNCNRGSSAQVTELLGKIEDMAARLKDHCHEMDTEHSQTNEDNNKAAEVMEEAGTAALKPVLAHASNPLPKELRVILLGHIASGKTSVMNTILDKEEFDTSQRTHCCVMGQGSVAGRQIILVDTPGWWSNNLLIKSPKHVLKEIVLSTSLCPPGPNAILLVIRVDCAFQAKSQTALQQHLGLLCEHVWRHALVLFTYGEWLGDASIEKHIVNEGEALQWVIEKCGYRYHVFHKDRADATQVTELLEKIEDMVAANRGCYYETDIQILMQMMEETYMRCHMQMEETMTYQNSFKLVFPVLPKYKRKAGEGNKVPPTVSGRLEFGMKGMTDSGDMMGTNDHSMDLDIPNITREPQEVKNMHLKKTKVHKTKDTDIKMQNLPKMNQSMDFFPPDMRGEDELDAAYASLTASSLLVSGCGSGAHSSASSLQSSGFCSLPNSKSTS